MKKNREAQARKVLVTIRGTTNVDREMQIMHSVCEEERRLKDQNSRIFCLFFLLLYNVAMFRWRRKEGNVLFNNALNTFNYGYMASHIW